MKFTATEDLLSSKFQHSFHRLGKSFSPGATQKVGKLSLVSKALQHVLGNG